MCQPVGKPNSEQILTKMYIYWTRLYSTNELWCVWCILEKMTVLSQECTALYSTQNKDDPCNFEFRKDIIEWKVGSCKIVSILKKRLSFWYHALPPEISHHYIIYYQSGCQLCRHWCHWLLSSRPPSVSPVMTNVASWEILVFSGQRRRESHHENVPLCCGVGVGVGGVVGWGGSKHLWVLKSKSP